MIQRRRTKSLLIGALFSIVAPLAALLGGLALDGEKIPRYWTRAELGDGSQDSMVTEAIDYDFGIHERRGIFRRIPDLDPEKGVLVTSATAPSQTRIGFGTNPEVRIGDPNVTITGPHRYFLEYSLDTLISADRFSWNAVGTEWAVSISEAEVHVVSDRELLAPTCDIGRFGSVGGCMVEQRGPGHLRVIAANLDSGEGITVSADLGSQLPASPTLPERPLAAALGEDVPIVVLMIGALLAALASLPLVGRIVQQMGREQVSTSTAAMLGDPTSLEATEEFRLVDETELAELAQPSAAPPRGLSAAHGGIVLAESVKPQHQVAWLTEAAFLGEVDVADDGINNPVLNRGLVTPRASTAAQLEAIFAQGDELRLKKYDANFAESWKELGSNLEQWKRNSGLWDQEGESRRKKGIAIGVSLAVVGAVAVALGAGLGLRWGNSWLLLMFAGALSVGGGLAILTRAWELRVRTPEGTSRWIQVESLRQFLNDLEPSTAADVIEPGAIHDYTSWAVAFGLDDRWKEISGFLKNDPRFAHYPATYFYLGAMGPSIQSAASTASTAPSSSSSGGGFSGGVGGGGGGGGGGSW